MSVLLSGECSHIQVGDKELVGEDQQLMKLLHEKINHDGVSLAPMTLPKRYHDNERLNREILANYNARRIHTTKDEDPKSDLDLKARTLDLMRHSIYLTQYRMQHLQRITDRYTKDIRFRVAMIFARLDSLIRDMRILYTVQNKSLDYYVINKTPFHTYIVYYAYFLRHNHDITYIVEYLIKLHTGYMMWKQREEEKKQALKTTPGPRAPHTPGGGPPGGPPGGPHGPGGPGGPPHGPGGPPHGPGGPPHGPGGPPHGPGGPPQGPGGPPNAPPRRR
ncbi:hypothetical protein evm_002984 [Chilo suppressalis]|nr:hypothetical protein evm_002984 [Chilo suppressalis]